MKRKVESQAFSETGTAPAVVTRPGFRFHSQPLLCKQLEAEKISTIDGLFENQRTDRPDDKQASDHYFGLLSATLSALNTLGGDDGNGLPARLNIREAPSGQAISQRSWIENRRVFEVWIDINIARQPGRERLFALASSLPKSTPACPDETPPEPFRIGPDGWPQSDPAPKTMTQAETDQRFADIPTARPCR